MPDVCIHVHVQCTYIHQVILEPLPDIVDERSLVEVTAETHTLQLWAGTQYYTLIKIGGCFVTLNTEYIKMLYTYVHLQCCSILSYSFSRAEQSCDSHLSCIMSSTPISPSSALTLTPSAGTVQLWRWSGEGRGWRIKGVNGWTVLVWSGVDWWGCKMVTSIMR